jgi:hypothetical protein
MTVPVSDWSVTFPLVQLAARASTACTAMYIAFTLKLSKNISAVYSLFSGAFRGGSVYNNPILSCQPKLSLSSYQ